MKSRPAPSNRQADLISTVAHELRTPITAIKGSIGLILGGAAGEVSDECRELLEIADGNCERLIRLVDDLLDLARAQAGALAIRPEEISIESCINSAVDSLRQYAPERNVEIEVRAESNLPPLCADPDRIEQVMVNLLSNAIKFSPRGSTVRVFVSGVGESVRISVKDEGPGIPESERLRVFDEFYQGRPSCDQNRGTGLGLAISRAIVREHGGRIYVSDSGSTGAEFVVELPLHPAVQADRDD